MRGPRGAGTEAEIDTQDTRKEKYAGRELTTGASTP